MPGMVPMRKAQPKRQGRSLIRHPPLPIIIGNETGLHAIPGVWPCYRGVFTGHSVLVPHLGDATSLHTMGCFGNPSTSKFNSAKPTVFRRRQYKLREEWSSRIPISNTKSTSKTESDSFTSTCESSDDDSCNDIQVESIRSNQKRVWEKQSDEEVLMSEHDDDISRCWYGSNWDSENIQPVYKKYKSSNNNSTQFTKSSKKSDINNRISSDDEITILSDSETSNKAASPTSPDILLIPNEKENKNPNKLIAEEDPKVTSDVIEKNISLFNDKNEEPEIINLDEIKEGTSNNYKEAKVGSTKRKEEIVIDITSPVKETVSQDLNHKYPSVVCRVLDFSIASKEENEDNKNEDLEKNSTETSKKNQVKDADKKDETNKEDTKAKEKEMPSNDKKSKETGEENLECSQKSQVTDENMSDSSEPDFHLHLSQSEDESSNSSQKQSTSKPPEIITLNEIQVSSCSGINDRGENKITVTVMSKSQIEPKKSNEKVTKEDTKDKIEPGKKSENKEKLNEKLPENTEKCNITKECNVKVPEKASENLENSPVSKEENSKIQEIESEIIEIPDSLKETSQKVPKTASGNLEKSDVILISNEKELEKVSSTSDATLSKDNITQKTAVKEKGMTEEVDSTKETIVKDDGPKETTIKDSSVKETTINDSSVKETTVNNSGTKEATVKDSSIKETTVNNSGAKEVTVKDSGVKETTVKGNGPKEATVINNGTKETTVKDSSVKETTVKDIGAKKTTVKNSGAKETTVKDSGAKETTVKGNDPKETTVIGNGPKETTVKDSGAKETTVKGNDPKETTVKGNGPKETTVKDSGAKEIEIANETTVIDRSTQKIPKENNSITDQVDMEIDSPEVPQEDDENNSLDLDICNMPITESGDYEAPEDISMYQEGRDCIVIADSDCEGDKEKLIKKWCPDFVKSTWNACDDSLVLSLEETFFLTWSLGCLNVTAPQSVLLQLLPPLHQSESVNVKDKSQEEEISIVSTTEASSQYVAKTSEQKDDDDICVVTCTTDSNTKEKDHIFIMHLFLEADVPIVQPENSADIIMLDIEEATTTTSEKPENNVKDVITVDMDTSECNEANKSNEIEVLSDQESECKSIVSLDQEPSSSKDESIENSSKDDAKTATASHESKQKSLSPQPGPSGMQNLQKIAQVYGLKDEGNGDVVLLPSVLWGLSCRQPNFPSRYVAYHHFRSLGWVVRSGIKFGGDFLLYQHGPSYNHATYVIIISRSNTPVSWQKIMTTNRIAEVTRKGVLLCYIEWPEGEESFEYLSKVNVKVRTISRPKIGRDQSLLNSNIQLSSSDGTDSEVSD